MNPRLKLLLNRVTTSLKNSQGGVSKVTSTVKNARRTYYITTFVLPFLPVICIFCLAIIIVSAITSKVPFLIDAKGVAESLSDPESGVCAENEDPVECKDRQDENLFEGVTERVKTQK